MTVAITLPLLWSLYISLHVVYMPCNSTLWDWVSFTFQHFSLIELGTLLLTKENSSLFPLVQWSPITGSSPNPPPSLISPLTSFTAAVGVRSKMWSLCGLKLHCLNRWKPRNPSPFSRALWGQGRWKTCVMTYSGWLGLGLAKIGCRWQPGSSLSVTEGMVWMHRVQWCTQFRFLLCKSHWAECWLTGYKQAQEDAA